MKKILFVLSVLFFFVATHAESSNITFYDVDFSFPPHVVGNAPLTGGGINTPSRISSGRLFEKPLVQNSLGALNDQPLVFNMRGRPYQTIEFDLAPGVSGYSVSFDLYTENFITSNYYRYFKVLFDTPSVRNIEFKRNGDIQIFRSFTDQEVIGSFNDNILMHMDIDIDLTNDVWNIAMNNTQLYSGIFGADNIFRMRIGLQESPLASIHNRTRIGLDNVLITDYSTPAPVPEPSTILLLGSGLFSVVALRKKIKKANQFNR